MRRRLAALSGQVSAVTGTSQARVDPVAAAELRRATVDLLDAVGLRDGAAHTELRLEHELAARVTIGTACPDQT